MSSRPQKILLALIAGAVLAVSGCAWRDAVWATFGSAYSGGGGSSAERQVHYQRSLDRTTDRWDGGVGHYDPILDR